MTLTEMSATGLAAAIRSGETSAREVVEAHIAVLERENPRIGAVVAERYDAARADADAADARLGEATDHTALPPLLGVPCTIKESIAVAGMPNCAGVLARRAFRAQATAPAAQRLLDAGAILLGVTNTSELCLWIESDNRVYGRTRNPYDPTRIAGGSSGGEGAAVGAGGSPLGLGSDIGGSIRIPAFCCGVFGHKPSPDLVPLEGHWPVAQGAATRLFTIGPLARRAEDLMPALRILSGQSLGDPAAVSLSGLRVLVSERAFISRIAPELLLARERAAGALAAHGARLERVSLSTLRRAVELYLAALSDGGAAGLSDILLAAGAAAPTWRAMLRRGGPHTAATRLLLAAERGSARPLARRATRALAAGQAFADELAATLGDGVLLHPPMPGVAPRHGRTVGRINWVHPMAVFNLAALPVTQVPLGLGREGLPLGVQVVAGRGNDHVAIAAALSLERTFGGWVPPVGRAPAPLTPTSSRAP